MCRGTHALRQRSNGVSEYEYPLLFLTRQQHVNETYRERAIWCDFHYLFICLFVCRMHKYVDVQSTRESARQFIKNTCGSTCAFIVFLSFFCGMLDDKIYILENKRHSQTLFAVFLLNILIRILVF